MNYYPFHVGDYVSATRHLSWDEDAAYRRMLDVYYTTEKPLPAEIRQVCRLVLATTDAQREAVQTVLSEFFEQTAEGWINRRADAEIAAMREKQQKQRDKANKRWDMQRTEPGTAPAMPRHAKADATAYATASKNDADAMPPTPTPTPIGGSASPRGSRLPHDELPKDWRDFALSERPDLDPDSVFARFADYWRAQPGAKGRKSDWLATWRNWVRDQRVTPRVAASEGQAMPWVGAL